MANTIQIKRKTTTGAPELVSLEVGEFCLVLPDDKLYMKKDATTMLEFPEVGSLLNESQFLRSDVSDNKTAGNLRFFDNVPIYFGTSVRSTLSTNGSQLNLNLLSEDFRIRDNNTTMLSFNRVSGDMSLWTGQVEAGGFRTSGGTGSNIYLDNGTLKALSDFLATSSINTLAKLNAIIADAILIDTNDIRLSDARTPLAHTHTQAEIEAELTGEITSHTHPPQAGAPPTENVILTATKTAGQNINGVEGTETDLSWDVLTQNAAELTSFSSGDADVVFTKSGWLNIHASAYITDGLANNRSMFALGLYHYDSNDDLIYAYHGDMQYYRDDNNGYDSSGGSVSQNMLKVSAGDYVITRMRVFEDGASVTVQTLDSTYSKLRISQIVF